MLSNDEIISLLKAKKTGRNQFLAQCPAHDDKMPSLSIRFEENGKLLLHCFAGCPFTNIITGIEAVSSEKSPALEDLSSEQNFQAAYVQRILNETIPADHERARPLRSYLIKRGLSLEKIPSSLLFHETLNYGDQFGTFPAIVANITDVFGNPVSAIHRTFLTEDGEKAPVPEPKKLLGASKSFSVHFGEPIGALNLAEGVETALAVQQATGNATWATLSATNLKNVLVPSEVSEVRVWVDKDRSETGQRAASDLANRLSIEGKKVFLHLPPLEIGDEKKGVDWLDVLSIQGNKPFLDSIQSTKMFTIEKKYESDLWQDPTPLPSILPKVPKLPPELVPEPVRPWIVDVAERIGVPFEAVALPVLSAAGSIVGRKLVVFPKQFDNWAVPPVLWGALVARPSKKKSAAIRAALKPIEVLEKKACEDFASVKSKISAEQIAKKTRKDSLIEQMKKAAKRKDEKEFEKLKEELTRQESEQESAFERRYKTNDATVEKIAELLTENPNGLLYTRDELSGWMRSLDKMGREGDREFFLESWNGLGGFRVDRIGRGTIHVPALCLTILGGIQPGKLEAYIHDAISGGSGDDGLLQRFQLLAFPDDPYALPYIDRKPDADSESKAIGFFLALDGLEPGKMGLQKSQDQICGLRFSSTAQGLFDEWIRELESRLDKELEPIFESHLAKYRSLMPALALLFHLFDFVSGKTHSKQISIESARLAGAWCDFLEQHALKVFAVAIRQDLRAAHSLLRKICKGDVQNGEPLRNIYRHHWTGLKTQFEVEMAATVLEKYGWVKVSTLKTGGAPSDILLLNPSIGKKHGTQI